MAKKQSTDFFSTLRGQGLRKSVAKALADLETGGRSAGGRAEKLGRQAIKDLRGAADAIEKRLDIGGAGTRSRAAKKAATTRKAGSAKRSAGAKKGAAKRSRKATAGGARKTARKTARKATKRS